MRQATLDDLYRDNWFTAQEAVDYSFIGKIVTKK